MAVEANEAQAETLHDFLLVRESIEALEEHRTPVKRFPEIVEDIDIGSEQQERFPEANR